MAYTCFAQEVVRTSFRLEHGISLCGRNSDATGHELHPSDSISVVSHLGGSLHAWLIFLLCDVP